MNKYKIAYCFVWVWNLVYNITGRKQAEGTGIQGTGERTGS